MGKVIFSMKVKEGNCEISAESSYDDVHSVEDLRAFAMAVSMAFESIRNSAVGLCVSEEFMKTGANKEG